MFGIEYDAEGQIELSCGIPRIHVLPGHPAVHYVLSFIFGDGAAITSNPETVEEVNNKY